jgi:hypothetical protein
MHSAKHYSIGIDPGKHGGICILSPDRKIVWVQAMPESEYGIWINLTNHILELIDTKTKQLPKMKACIELVTGYVSRSDEYGGDRGSNAFVFGQNVGIIKGILAALDLYPYISPSPRKWQSELSISPRDSERESKAGFKRRLKDEARKLFPNDKITLETCDAVLLAYYCSFR